LLEDAVKVVSGISDSDGESFFGSVDLGKELLLVLVTVLSSVLELANSLFDISTLIDNISDEIIACNCNAILDTTFVFDELAFNCFAGSDKPCLELSSAGLEISLSFVFECSVPYLKFAGSAFNLIEKVVLDGWEVTDEVSVEEGFDFVVAWNAVGLKAVVLVAVVRWVVCGGIVRWSTSLWDVFVHFCGVSLVSVVLLQPPDPLLDEIVEVGVDSGVLEGDGGGKSMSSGLD
jgi:hypothetical protein